MQARGSFPRASPFVGYTFFMSLRDDIAALIKGDALDDTETIKTYSRDTSIFLRAPKVVVFPKDEEDVRRVVTYVIDKRSAGGEISIAPRSAGTDMTGGDLTDSISLVFTKYMNHMIEVGKDYAITEPGVYYRDFEKETLAKAGAILPSYPASRQLCAMGGIVANNSGGELTLRYGKTNKYIRELDVILADGQKVTLRPLSMRELELKKSLPTFEGQVYQKTHALLEAHAAVIAAARPSVTKNSAGYALWNIIDKEKATFDLTQLFAGSQGTLGIIVREKLGLIKPKEKRALLVVFVNDLKILPDIVHKVLRHNPESFESYDDQTFSLAVRFIPQIIGHLGLIKMLKLGFAFLPEAFMALTGGIPKLVLMAEFAEDDAEEALKNAQDARRSLDKLPVQTKIAQSDAQIAKYWTIRRESFSLLRKNIKGRFAAPFIDDLVVHPDDYATFLPELDKLVRGHKFIYTIAGHVGDGNFHIIPLEDMSDPAARAEIVELMPKVFELVAKYKGSITGEHNDGIIRTPYLPIMYGQDVCDLFLEVKKIFDPLGILNPGKKTGGTIDDITRSMITHV
jgi:FAD/FMN-containing dehydrogenase